MEKDKKVVIIADLHAGHRVGIAPPGWSGSGDKFEATRNESYSRYGVMIEKQKPIHVLIINGDSIEGKGLYSEGVELITSDRIKQVDIAEEVIKIAEADHIVMTYGTPNHTGKGEDFEKILADRLGAKIGNHEWVEVNKTVFDIKHKVGSSAVPYGRATAPQKERLWNLLWTEFKEQPKADVIVRSHVHYFSYSGEDHWLALTTPALQAMGSTFGARQCIGHVDFGIVHFNCMKGGGYTWGWDIARLITQRAEAMSL